MFRGLRVAEVLGGGAAVDAGGGEVIEAGMSMSEDCVADDAGCGG